HLEGVARRGQQPLELTVQRALAEHADAGGHGRGDGWGAGRRHLHKLRAKSCLTFCRALCILPPTVSETVFGTMEERVTIRELARRSGVSVGTVSRALNG